jgi:hypothetical protein
MYSGREAVNLFRLKMILTGLRAEAVGMRLTRKGPSCLTIAKREMGLKGDRDSIIAQVVEIIKAEQAKIQVVQN